MATESDMLSYLAEKGDLSRLRSSLASRPQAINLPDSRGYPPLFAAALKNRVEIVRFLIGAGAEPETHSGSEKYTALMIAIIQQQDRAAAVLAEATINPNVQDQFGRTALHYASDFGKKSLVDILLTKGADPNVEDQEGKSPTLLAHLAGHREVLSTLQAKDGVLVPERLEREKKRAALDRHLS